MNGTRDTYSSFNDAWSDVEEDSADNGFVKPWPFTTLERWRQMMKLGDREKILQILQCALSEVRRKLSEFSVANPDKFIELCPSNKNTVINRSCKRCIGELERLETGPGCKFDRNSAS